MKKVFLLVLAFFSNIAIAETDATQEQKQQELFKCIEKTQARALKVSKGMANYAEILDILKKDNDVMLSYIKNVALDDIKNSCADIFAKESNAHAIIDSVYNIGNKIAQYQNKIIEDYDSYSVYDITDQYYIFQKQDVTPVNVFIAIPKNKTPHKYKYNYDDMLTNAYPLFVPTTEASQNKETFRRFYKIAGVTKVFNSNTKKMISMALVLEPIILK